jgi:hypothetical protein
MLKFKLSAEAEPKPRKNRGTTVRTLAVALTISMFCVASSTAAQKPDYTTVRGMMNELYSSIDRRPGETFQWDRFRALFLPGATMIPQRRMLGGASRIMTVDEVVTWIDDSWKERILTPKDPGIFEIQRHLVVEEYGDIAQAFSTYEKRWYEPARLLGHGINSVQLVKRDGRWFISSIVWDEDNTSGEIPEKYRGAAK